MTHGRSGTVTMPAVPGGPLAESAFDPTVSPMAATDTPTRSRLSGWVQALRPRQWVKNILVFAAPAAAGTLGRGGVLAATGGAFACFCAAASGTYLLNDAADVHADRQHPTKRLRPIAAGLVPAGGARLLALILIAGAVTGGFALHAALGVIITVYVVQTVAYTVRLKHVAVIELAVLASGFVYRAVAGGAATGTPISSWFLVVIGGASMMMATGKRTAELVHGAGTRRVLSEYTPQFLGVIRAASLGLALTAYCLWAFDDRSTGITPSHLSVVPFSLALLRFTQRAENGEAGEPEKLILTDRTILLLGAAWAAMFAVTVARS